jgi:hypothetical protein
MATKLKIEKRGDRLKEKFHKKPGIYVKLPLAM